LFKIDQDITLASVNGEYFVIPSYYNGELIGDALNKADKSLKIKQGRGRNCLELSIKTERGYSEKVEFSYVLFAIEQRQISGFSLKKSEALNKKGMCLHHVGDVWDNRRNSTMALTTEQHKRVHSITGQHSHRMGVQLNDLADLYEFVEYLQKEGSKNYNQKLGLMKQLNLSQA
jgi:hypothetical protein